jgi:hypothetical protein
MSIYNLNTENFGKHLMPPYKRLPRYLSWIYVLLYPLQWLHDLFFNTYADGDYSAVWDVSSTYTKGQVVQYLDYQTYVAIQNVPIFTPCIDTNYWLLVGDNVGLRQRANVTGQKLLLEWVLNKHYNTTFRQPAIGTSDIYVAGVAIDTNYFVAGIDGQESSFAAISGQDAIQFVGTSYTYDTESLIIYVPNATLDLITQGTESAPYPEAQKVVLYYAYRFIFAGIIAKVEGY